MRKNKKPSPPKSGQTLRSLHTLIARIAFRKVFHPFPKSHSGQANASSSASERENGEREAVRRSSCGWNAVYLLNSNIASLKEQSVWGPWDVLLDLAEKEFHSWVWGSGMKRASPESMGVVQCSQVGADRGSVLSSSLCSHGPVQLASPANSKSEKRHSFLNVSVTVVKAQREFSRWIHSCRLAVLFVYVSLFNLRPWNSEPLKVTPSQQHSQIKENRD